MPFPERFSARLAGRTVLAVQRRAKYLLLPVSSPGGQPPMQGRSHSRS